MRVGVAVAVGVLLVARAAAARDVPVSTAAELATAIQSAQPGDVIILEDGSYASDNLSCARSGTMQAPIVVKARHPRAAEVVFSSPSGIVEGFKVSGDHWRFEDLVIRGACADDDRCEHGIHVAGASGFVVRESRLVDFNAQIKVNARQNGATWVLPQAGLVENNEFYDTRAHDVEPGDEDQRRLGRRLGGARQLHS